jgi:hypothetical protein
VHYDSCGLSQHLDQFHGKAIDLDVEDPHAPLPLMLLFHEYMVRGRNFYRSTPDVEVTSGRQELVVNEGVLNEKANGSIACNREAPTLRPLAGQSLNMQTLPATQFASSSGSRTAIKPPTADLVEELMAYQCTMPTWKVCQTEGKERGERT